MEIEFEKDLNKQQFNAVSSNSKYLRIIAGAGSGKTRVLVYRVLYLLLEERVDPASILAITFTNKAAGEMKARIANFVEKRAFKEMLVLTFHSFCAYFLRREINCIGRDNNFSIMDEEDQKNLVKSICKEEFDDSSKDIVNGSINFINYYTGKNKTSSELNSNNIRFANDEKYLKVFKLYEAEKEKTNNLDFDDLLNFSVRILKKFEDIRKKWSVRFSNILIDEFQDTNDVQHELLLLLLNSSTNLFVVGDPDQAIYGFRGANTKLIMDFEKTFQGSKTIILDENYRSTKNILNAANKVISNNKKRVEKNLFTSKKDGDEVVIKKCFSKIDEGRFIADKISDLVENNGYQYKDIAILYRTTFCSNPIEKALVARKIPLRMYGGQRFYKRMEIKDLISYFTLFVNTADDISFLRIINIPKRKIGDSCINIINKERSLNKLSFYDYIKKVNENETDLTPSNYQSLKELINLLEKFSNMLKDQPNNYPKILEEFVYEIGYMNYLNDFENSDDRKDNVKALISDLEDFKKENPDESFVVWLQNALLTQSSDDLDPNADCVSLMTVHVAKGLEYKVVFVVSLDEGIFPHFRAIEESANGLEEERRIFYVAMTRAKELLFLSYNSDMNFISNDRGEPSKFLKELGYVDSSYYSDEHYYEPKGKRYVSFSNNKYKEDSKSNLSSDLVKDEINLIKWELNDICEHETFGVGKIIGIDGEGENQTVDIEFIKCGKKTILANHKSLRKVIIK